MNRAYSLAVRERLITAACQLAGAPNPPRPFCPVAERLFEHELVAIPHEVLLGDDADVDDIVAAAAKIASCARELAGAKLDRTN